MEATEEFPSSIEALVRSHIFSSANHSSPRSPLYKNQSFTTSQEEHFAHSVDTDNSSISSYSTVSSTNLSTGTMIHHKNWRRKAENRAEERALVRENGRILPRPSNMTLVSYRSSSESQNRQSLYPFQQGDASKHTSTSPLHQDDLKTREHVQIGKHMSVQDITDSEISISLEEALRRPNIVSQPHHRSEPQDHPKLNERFPSFDGSEPYDHSTPYNSPTLDSMLMKQDNASDSDSILTSPYHQPTLSNRLIHALNQSPQGYEKGNYVTKLGTVLQEREITTALDKEVRKRRNGFWKSLFRWKGKLTRNR